MFELYVVTYLFDRVHRNIFIKLGDEHDFSALDVFLVLYPPNAGYVFVGAERVNPRVAQHVLEANPLHVLAYEANEIYAAMDQRIDNLDHLNHNPNEDDDDDNGN